MESSLLDTLLAAYQRHAADALRLYSADALINSLEYPRRDEELAVATFVRAIQEAARAYLAAPLDNPSAPSWERVEEELPDFPAALREAIGMDNRARRKL
jgi:glucosyl-3-phosphoglycerate synthase